MYYAQFIDLVGKTKKMNIIIPGNEDVSGYDNILYQLYFDLDNFVFCYSYSSLLNNLLLIRDLSNTKPQNRLYFNISY